MLNKSIEHLKKAIYQLQIAEHLLEVTYPLVKDPKMLISVLSNLEHAQDSIFEAILPLNLANADTDFVTKLNSFEDLLRPQMVLDKGIIKSISSVHDLLNQHKESSVVFSRKKSFVICDDDYSMKKIDEVSVGEYLHNTNKLLKNILTMVENND